MQVASKITGVASYIPGKKITNDDVKKILIDKSKGYLSEEELITLNERVDYLLARAGSDIRYWCNDHEYCIKYAWTWKCSHAIWSESNGRT